MADFNVLQPFLDPENTFLGFDKKETDNKRDEQYDFGSNLGDFFGEDILNSFIDNILSNEATTDRTNYNCGSDSGLSDGQSLSPLRTDDFDEMQLVDPILLENKFDVKSILPSMTPESPLMKPESPSMTPESLHDSTINEVESFDALDFVKEEIVEYEEIHVDSISDATDSNLSSDFLTVEEDDHKYTQYASNFDTELLEGSEFDLEEMNLENDDTDKNTSDDSDSQHTHLVLTPEEQKLANKEGIVLPSHYPLTKAQERDLKRIRRKIRNKISAQDSRRRKREYVDNLEEKMKRTTAENVNLVKRIKKLESQKVTLVAQVRKLQAALARSTGQTAQPSTCLLVLIMSMALILAPSLRNSTLDSKNSDDEGISIPEKNIENPTTNRIHIMSRNLLFSQRSNENQCDIEEEAQVLAEQLKTIRSSDSNILSGLLQTIRTKFGEIGDSPMKEHNYITSRKHKASFDVAKDEDEPWPPSKMFKNAQNFVNSLIINNKNKSDASATVIDLLSE